MKYKVVISYDGSKFHGFQRQKDVRNVQSTIENYLSKYFKEDIVIKGAGRTDAKVHANGQVISFSTDKCIKILKRDFNRDNNDIKIKNISQVCEEFHPRFNANEKEYLYKLDTTGKKDNNYFGYSYYKFDLKKMRDASKLFLGTHDFRNFTAGSRDDYVSTIKKIRIYKLFGVIYFRFIGYGFYRYMVRNLVGALLLVGRGKIDDNIILDVLNTKEKRDNLSTAKPEGLYLIKIKYN